MTNQEKRGYEAIQTAYALLAAKINDDKYGISLLIPEQDHKLMDTIEALLVSIYLTVKNTPAEKALDLALLNKLSPELKEIIIKVNNKSIKSESQPLEIILLANPGFTPEAIIGKLLIDFEKIWLTKYDSRILALKKVQEICQINLEFSLKN